MLQVESCFYKVECCFDIVAIFGDNVEGNLPLCYKVEQIKLKQCSIFGNNVERSRKKLLSKDWCGRICQKSLTSNVSSSAESALLKRVSWCVMNKNDKFLVISSFHTTKVVVGFGIISI